TTNRAETSGRIACVPPASAVSEVAANGGAQAVGGGARRLEALGLDHDPHDGLGAAGPEQHPAGAAQLGLDGRHLVPDGAGRLQPAGVGDGQADELLRQAGHRLGRQCSKRPGATAKQVEELEPRQYPVAGGGETTEDDVPRLLATENEPTLLD